MRAPLIALILAAPALAKPSLLQPDGARHAYVLGRLAAADSDLSRAVVWLDAARASDPAQQSLTRRAFEVAVAAGDQPRSFALARQLAAQGQADADVQMVRLAEALQKKDLAGAAAARKALGQAGYVQLVGPIIDAWLLQAKGDADGALAMLNPQGYQGFIRSYVAEQRAHMLSASGRWEEAARAWYGVRLGSGAGISFARVGEADALAMAGRKDAALAALSGDDPASVAARARLAAGKRIGPLAGDAGHAIAWMCARLAGDLARERPVPLALLFGRLANYLAPDNAAAWLISGDVLARAGQRGAAMTAYAMVPVGDALHGTARARRAEVLDAMGRKAEAVALLQGAAQAPGATAGDWLLLGHLHRRNDRFAEAADAYGEAIKRDPDGSGEGGWSPWFLRGSMFERAGRWKEAEADLREAARRAPKEATILNYLGYSLLDRGESLAEATKLIEAAAEMRPGDGGIIDSLGWTQYRAGRYADAVLTLERAAMLEPIDPTVTDHLGDAYWQVGRRIEARFQWRHALALDPDDRQRARLRAKLDYGLDAALAMAEAPH